MGKDFSFLFFVQLITGGGIMFLSLVMVRVLIWDNKTLYDRISGLLAACIFWILFMSYSGMSGLWIPRGGLVDYSYLPAFFTVGPAVYFFVRASVDPDYRLDFKRALHFGPAVTIILFLAIYFALPANAGFDRYPFEYLQGGALHFLDYVFFAALLHSSAYYTYLFYRARPVFHMRDSRDIGPSGIFYRLYFLGAVVGILPILGYIFRSEMIMWVLCALMSLIVMSKSLIQLKYPELFDQLTMAMERTAYKKSRLLEVDTDALGHRLTKLMEEDKIFIDENLNVTKMAELLGVKHYQLREYLNVHLNTNFPAFINQYRIREAVSLLESAHRPNMLNIAFRVGFNSKATFNLAFRKIMNCSPTEHLRKSGTNPSS